MNNSFDPKEFFKKLNQDTDRVNQEKEDSLFEKEAEEGWALVKNKKDREKSLFEAIDKAYDPINTEKIKLKKFAPFVAIAASLLLIIGIFSFFSNWLNQKNEIAQNSENQNKIITHDLNNFPPEEKETQTKLEKDETSITTSTESSKENYLPEKKSTDRNSNLLANTLQPEVEKHYYDGNLNSGEKAEGIYEKSALDSIQTISESENFKESVSLEQNYDQTLASAPLLSKENVEKDKEVKTKSKKARSKSEITSPAEEQKPTSIFFNTDNSFEFQGGETALKLFIEKNRKKIKELKAPKKFATHLKFSDEGKAIFIQLEDDLNCSDCQKEIERIIQTMPLWVRSSNVPVSKKEKIIVIELYPEN